MDRDLPVDQEECRPLLVGNMRVVEKREQPHDRVLGLFWTFVVASLVLGTAIVTSLASGMEQVPRYTENFIRCLAASATLRIVTLLRCENLLPPRDSIMQCFNFGIADWFFLWGYVKALVVLTVLHFTAITSSIGPMIAAVMGFVCINEGLSKYKIFVLVRNMALALLIVNPFGSAISLSTLGVGIFWTVVANAGTGAMRIVQRTNTQVPGTVLTFWGYVLNTILWFPPGCTPPKLRVSFLWPAEAEFASQSDLSDLPVSTWIVLVLSGVLGAAVMVTQGFALKYLDVATYSMLVTPLGLVLTTLFSAIKYPISRIALCGVFMQVAALLFDAYQERRREAIQ